MPNVRRNMLVDVSPQSGIALTVDLKMGPSLPITTATTGLIATAVGRGGAGGYAYSIVAGSVPSGTTFDNATGKLTRTGTLVVGTSYFTVQVQDSAGAVFPHTFSITVNSRLVVVRGTPSNGHGGAPYTFSFLVTGGTGTISYAITSGAGGLPPNVSLTAAGVLATVPSGSDIPFVGFGGMVVPFTVTATDSGSGESVPIPINWFLYSSLTAPPGASLPAPLLTGVPYFWSWYPSPTESFIGGLPPYTFTVTSGSLPPGVTLNSATGEFSGIPSAAGSGIFSWQCTDAWGANSATGAVPWVVRDPQNAIQPQLNGSSVGTPGPINFNFVNATVTNDGTTTNITVPAGTVTGVTATTPIVSSGGTAPNISHANSGASAGTYTYPTITVNASGHVTAASSGAAPVTSVGATSPITSTGGATPTIAHANSGVSAGTYGYATVTVNASGHVTSISANSVGSAASYNIGTAGAVVPRLDYACTWSAAQAFGTSNATLTLAAAYSPGSVTPASTATWYRIATLPAANLGQDAVITVGVNRNAGGGVSAYRFRLFKTTWDGTQGTGVEYSSVGNYSVAYGITNARVVDGGSNQPSYLDVQLATVEAHTVRIMAESRCIGGASPVTLGWASQGTASAGMAFTVAGNWYVAGDSTQGVSHSISRYGAWQFEDAATFVNGVVLPGTTSQYVRGDGSLATLPGGGSGTVTSVSAGAGMSFGTISTSGSVAMGTPSTLTASTSNSASGSTHTHAISGFLPLTGGTLTGTLTGTTIQASTIKETSDRRLKREITALRDGLAIVRALSPVRYRRACTEEHEVGLIAQDVDLVLPEVVAIGGDGTLAVGYARIVAPLIAAVQELEARLIAAEERIAALEAR